MKRKKIDKMQYATKYYNKHKAEIDTFFGNQKNWLDNVNYNLRNTYYTKATNARLDMQDLIQAKKGGDVELAFAKRTAVNKDVHFPDARALNKRIEAFDAKVSNAKWTDQFGYNKEVKQYYEIKNSNLVLANIITTEPSGGSPIETWEYIDKNYV